ncbi:MAG: hypothetical protein ACREJC_00060 [Tepidisphaeraceae bacterium]
MASTALPASGLLLQVSATSGGSYTSIAGVLNPQPFGLARKMIDATPIAEDVEEVRPGKMRITPMSFTIQFVPTSTVHKALYNDLVSKLAQFYKVIWPDTGATVWGPVECYVEEFMQQGLNNDGNMEAKVTLRPKANATVPA